MTNSLDCQEKLIDSSVKVLVNTKLNLRFLRIQISLIEFIKIVKLCISNKGKNVFIKST